MPLASFRDELGKAKERRRHDSVTHSTTTTHTQKHSWMLLISVFYAGWLVVTARRELARCRVASLIKLHANDGLSQKTAAERHSFRLRLVFFRLPSPSVSLPLTHATLAVSCIKRCKPPTFIRVPYCSQSAPRLFSSTANLFSFPLHLALKKKSNK